MPRNDNVIAALDVGTSKVTTLVATIGPNGKVQFVGKGVSRNRDGMIAGNVVNMEATSRAISESIIEADKICDQHIKSVILGLSGEHVAYINSHGVVTVRGREVAQTDIDRVLEQARNVSLPGDRRIVGCEIGEYIVDDQSGIKNPKGMAGRRLEVKVHILTASTAMIQNLVKSVNEAGIEVRDIVVNGLASSYAVLEEDEKQLGAAVVDIGEGTTDIVVYRSGKPVYTAVIPMGGRFITMDISYALRIPPAEAERIKCEFGCAVPNAVSKDDEIEVPGIGDKEKKIVKVHILSNILVPRVEEIMMSVRKKLHEDNLKDNFISSGIVLTGGSANLKYIRTLAEEVLGLHVRVGAPILSDDGMGFADVLQDPSYASAVGIIRYYARHGGQTTKAPGGFFARLGEILRKFFE